MTSSRPSLPPPAPPAPPPYRLDCARCGLYPATVERRVATRSQEHLPDSLRFSARLLTGFHKLDRAAGIGLPGCAYCRGTDWRRGYVVRGFWFGRAATRRRQTTTWCRYAAQVSDFQSCFLRGAGSCVAPPGAGNQRSRHSTPIQHVTARGPKTGAAVCV